MLRRFIPCLFKWTSCKLDWRLQLRLQLLLRAPYTSTHEWLGHLAVAQAVAANSDTAFKPTVNKVCQVFFIAGLGRGWGDVACPYDLLLGPWSSLNKDYKVGQLSSWFNNKPQCKESYECLKVELTLVGQQLHGVRRWQYEGAVFRSLSLFGFLRIHVPYSCRERRVEACRQGLVLEQNRN